MAMFCQVAVINEKTNQTINRCGGVLKSCPHCGAKGCDRNSTCKNKMFNGNNCLACGKSGAKTV